MDRFVGNLRKLDVVFCIVGVDEVVHSGARDALARRGRSGDVLEKPL